MIRTYFQMLIEEELPDATGKMKQFASLVHARSSRRRSAPQGDLRSQKAPRKFWGAWKASSKLG